jgi:hypothetical protein|tara:strand:- start:917 stop:1240 length:324 start_codon:yes stop_codon:yes gene_type:complete
MPTVGYKQNNRMTAEEIEVRIWAVVIFSLTMILLGSVAMFLYSVSFVTQPMSGMAAIDKVYTQQINTIMVFITGVLGGVAGRSAVSASAKAFAKADADADSDEPPKP